MLFRSLLCQRHHTVVHQRRLMAEVHRKPDERGRYVVWDLSPGSYDEHLDRLRAERTANDPPSLTPERLRSLLDAIHGDDPNEQRWARYELDASATDEEWSDEWSPDDEWVQGNLASLHPSA